MQTQPVINILLLEPDKWRFRAIKDLLEQTHAFRVAGDLDYAKYLTSEQAPDDLHVKVVLLSDLLVFEFGVSIVAQLRNALAPAPILVYGEHGGTHHFSSVMAAGASGFFDMSGPDEYLHEAVAVVAEGRIWAPQETLALLAQRIAEPDDGGPPEFETSIEVDDNQMLLLRCLREGLSSKEIAARLHVAELTVKARLEFLYQHFHATTPKELLSAVLRHGLVV